MMVESNALSIVSVLPLLVGCLHGCIVHTKTSPEKFDDLLNFSRIESDLEEAGLLRQEPLSKFLISTVSEPADKVRNIVVLAEFEVVRTVDWIQLSTCVLPFES